MEELIYKYSPWNKYIQDSLVKRYFWFSKPTNFNDPFDSNMDMLGAFNISNNIFSKRKNPENDYETLLEYIKRETNDFGILCLTKKTKKGDIGDKGFNNIHFWSHYANSYKGISIGYDAKKIENYYSEKLLCKASLLKVNYIENPVDINIFDFIITKDDKITKTKRIKGIFGESDDKAIDAFFEQILLFKDKRVWGIENEYRIILAGLALKNLKDLSSFSKTNFEIYDKKGYRIPYPKKNIIKEVTFGVNFDIKELNETVKLISTYNENVKFYTTSLDFVNADIIREEIK